MFNSFFIYMKKQFSTVLTLKFARRIANQLQSIARFIRFEITARRPGILAIVGRLLNDWEQRDNVLGRTAQEQNGDGAVASRLPGDGVWRANRDDLIQRRLGDGVAGGPRRRLRVGVDGRKAGHEEGEGGEVGRHSFFLSSLFQLLQGKEPL